jgi:hypothetical protein
MAKSNPAVELVITEIQRSGDGLIDPFAGLQVFRWSSSEHASPQGDIELNLQVTSVRKNMPGSNQVVEHAMSATWQPFEFTGEWDDKWGNRGGLTGSYANAMFQSFSKFVSRMPLVRWELDALSFTGLITNLKVKYRTQSYIIWSATLSPHENTAVEVVSRPAKAKQPITKWIQDATDHGSALKDSYEEAKKLSLKTPRLSLFTVVLLEINNALDRLQGIGSDFLMTETEQKLLLLASTFRRLRGASMQAHLALARTTSSLDIAFGDLILSLKHEEWIASTVVAAWQMMDLSTSAEKDVRSRARQKPKAIYYPKRGESLERISLRFYGTADNWRLIYDKNNLSSYVLNGSEELLIPERST